MAAGAEAESGGRGRGRPAAAAAEECQQQEGSVQRRVHAVIRGRSTGQFLICFARGICCSPSLMCRVGLELGLKVLLITAQPHLASNPGSC